MNNCGEIYRISTSPEKGLRKKNVDEVEVVEDFGIRGDAHAGSPRQISLLPYEEFDIIREKLPEIKPGDFAENITTRGLDFSTVKIGDEIVIGPSVKAIVTQIGKKCHNDCEIKRIVGDCIMPRYGVFASIQTGGRIKVGDKIEWGNGHD